MKDILYAVIENIGREKIQADVVANISSSQNYINIILAECIANLNVGPDPDDNEKAIATLGEALLHFMLTVCTIPSERKIHVKENLTLDVIIPNLRGLKKEPEKSIIIQFIKDDAQLSNVSGLGFLQPNYENIWLVCVRPPLSSKYTTYCLLYSDTEYHNNNNYSNIIINISKFLGETGDNSFKFIHWNQTDLTYKFNEDMCFGSSVELRSLKWHRLKRTTIEAINLARYHWAAMNSCLVTNDTDLEVTHRTEHYYGGGEIIPTGCYFFRIFKNCNRRNNFNETEKNRL